MAAAGKKTKADPAPKKDTAAATEAPKTESTVSASDTAPANYSRGEGQKMVTQAYRDNWHAIFGKKPARNSKAAGKRKTRR
jgi:hypothetical protein